jgi:DNA-binding LacI/PurR family transcriptional regulator
MTLQDIAKKLHVSSSTVSRALNPAKAHLISGPVRKEILSWAERVNYVPNQAARNLVGGKSQTVGVILYSAFGSLFFSDYLSKVQWGIYAALGDASTYGCKLIVLPRGKSLSTADYQVVGSGVDGLLISIIADFAADRLKDLVRTVERRWRRPLVALNLPPVPNSQISTVSFSNYQAAYEAVTHLIRRGHTRIGLIFTDDGSPDVAERVQAYKTALEDHHLPYEPHRTTRGQFMPQSGYQAALELFKRKENDSLTALFCTNDEMAIGVMRALKMLRKRCPEDVAVMGFDGLAIGEFLSPALSSVAQPTFEMAKAGMQLLLDLIEKRKKSPVHLIVPTELTIRDST